MNDMNSLPNFCAHEHWGSIDAIGTVSEGYRADTEQGATPTRPVSLFDLLLDPYFRGHLTAAGADPAAATRAAGFANVQAWAAEDPDAAWSAVAGCVEPQLLTGTFQCIRRGIMALHGADIGGEFDLAALNTSIAARYERLFHWYRGVMDTAGFSGLIRPVHPEFYVRESSPESAREERAMTHTVLRIDPFLSLWEEESPRRDGLAKAAGVYPRDAESWRAFLAKWFDIAAHGGAVGIKQLQAYGRTLDFAPIRDEDVVWRGTLAPPQATAFEDWVVHECCRLAEARGWPHQVHTGTHNLGQSSPMPLAALAARYRGMKIVMLHNWPFIDECGWLAKYTPNIYIDTCWQPVLSPSFFSRAMRQWLTYVPANKIMCSHDSTSVEMAVGSSLFTREILAGTLEDGARAAQLPSNRLDGLAARLLHGNAAEVYGNNLSA